MVHEREMADINIHSMCIQMYYVFIILKELFHTFPSL